MFDNKVKYIINEDERKVICVIEGTALNFVHFIDKQSKFPLTVDLFNKLLMPDRFVGIATCGLDDEFNPEIGKTIAYSRAKVNLDKSFFKRANTYVGTLDDWLTNTVIKINSYGEKLGKNADYRTNKINYMLGVDNGNERNS